MLIDLASLGVSLAPPKGILKKNKGPGQSISDPISGSTAPLTPKSKKSKLNVQLTKVAVGISNVVVGYQTLVEVARADRPEDEKAPLTLTCTECITLQELTAEAFPSAFKGSVQANNLAVLHQEVRSVSASDDSPSGPKQSAPHREVEILHAKHLTLAVDPTSQTPPTAPFGIHTQQGSGSASLPNLNRSSRPDEQGLAVPVLPNLAATIVLSGWHTVFHADAVIGLCKAAADFACVARQTATSLQSTETAHTASSTDQMPMINPPESPLAAAPATEPAQDTEASVTRQLSKLHRLPVVMLTVQVSKWKTDAVIADHIVWGINLSEAQCKLDSRTLVAIQLQHLHSQLTHQQQQQLSQGAVSSNSSLQGSAAEAESPSLTVRHISVSLNRKPLLHCGEVEGFLDLWPARGSDSGARHNLPGSPRRQASLGEPVTTLCVPAAAAAAAAAAICYHGELVKHVNSTVQYSTVQYGTGQVSSCRQHDPYMSLSVCIYSVACQLVTDQASEASRATAGGFGILTGSLCLTAQQASCLALLYQPHGKRRALSKKPSQLQIVLQLQTGLGPMMSMQLPTPEQACPNGQQSAFQSLVSPLTLPVKQLLCQQWPLGLLLLYRPLCLMSC